jgi:diphthamide biosynthesis protein 2
LVQRAKGDLALVGGEVSPGAQFLRDKRTWRGLGSDFEIAYENEDKDSTAIKEGRSGIARGYENEKPGG